MPQMTTVTNRKSSSSGNRMLNPSREHTSLSRPLAHCFGPLPVTSSSSSSCYSIIIRQQQQTPRRHSTTRILLFCCCCCCLGGQSPPNVLTKLGLRRLLRGDLRRRTFENGLKAANNWETWPHNWNIGVEFVAKQLKEIEKKSMSTHEAVRKINRF